MLPLVAPAVAILVHRPRIDWTGDRALTELGVRQAAHLHQRLGMGGRFGWRHPGPLWLYLLAPVYELSGRQPWSLAVGALALHAVLVGVSVVAAGRAAGVRAAAVMAVLIAVYVRATGLVYWTNLWAGYAFAWPILALIVVGAVSASQRRAGWALPAAALIGTLAVQTDVSTIVVAVFVCAMAAALRVYHHGLRALVATSAGAGNEGPPAPPAPPDTAGRVRPNHSAHHAPRRRGRRSPATLALMVAVLLAWVPPLVEQLSAHTGNLTLLARFGRQPDAGHPLRLASAAVGASLSVVPIGARWVLQAGVEQRLGAGPWWAVALTVGYLAGTVATIAVAWRRRRRFAGDLAALSLVGVLAAVASIARLDGPVNFYLLSWVTLLPVPSLAGAVLAFAPTASPHAPRERPRIDLIAVEALVLAAVLATDLVATEGTVHDWDRRSSADVVAQSALATSALGPALPATVRVHILSPDTWPDAAGVALQLERLGAHIEVDPDWVFLFGDAFAARPGGGARAELWFARRAELPLLAGRIDVIDLGMVGGIDLLAHR